MPSVTATDLGPAFIGVFINGILQGAMGLQCCVYYSYFPNDANWMKGLVGLLLFADSVHTVFSIQWVYEAFVLHFMSPSLLTTTTWIFAACPALTGIIATMVQIFFAWRIQVLTQKTWLVWFIRLTSLGSLSCGIGTAVAIRLVKSFLDLYQFKPLVMVWFASSVVCDLAITTTLTAFMTRHKTGNAGTDKIMHKLTHLSITNGLLVTVVAIANLVAFLSSTTGVYLLFNFPLAKLYTCSLMSTLNSRIGSQDTLVESSRKVSEMTASSKYVPRPTSDLDLTSRSGSESKVYADNFRLSTHKEHVTVDFSQPPVGSRLPEGFVVQSAV